MGFVGNSYTYSSIIFSYSFTLISAVQLFLRVRKMSLIKVEELWKKWFNYSPWIPWMTGKGERRWWLWGPTLPILSVHNPPISCKFKKTNHKFSWIISKCTEIILYWNWQLSVIIKFEKGSNNSNKIIAKMVTIFAGTNVMSHSH